ncbi:MAG: ubiquinone/menaquinone biosynthesis methyltransferase [Candidatus Omnitrophica bacterium]|nr:ubiquinone/menaquinone biosynthesis methyltransferase [Candidatus Omnitrophota bacterium]
MTSATNLASPDSRTIRGFFDEIAFRYDFLNSLLSFRLDDYWRSRTKKLVLDGREQAVLDLGVGTGRYLAEFLRAKTFQRAVGVDFSAKMLERSRQELPPGVRFVRADFHHLPFPEAAFDLVISSFTLRSVKDLTRFFDEIYRVLNSRGKAAFLCLTRPQGLFRWFYKPYLKYYLPFVGRFFSGGSEAYQFLSESIQHFQEPGATVSLLRQRGFQTIQVHRLTFGAATLIVAKK